jgi:hypothetical protein
MELRRGCCARQPLKIATVVLSGMVALALSVLESIHQQQEHRYAIRLHAHHDRSHKDGAESAHKRTTGIRDRMLRTIRGALLELVNR